MPKSKSSKTDTSIPQAGGRQLFGAGAALLLLAPNAAGSTKAAELDGDLLTLCAEYGIAAAERETLDDGIVLATTGEREDYYTLCLDHALGRCNTLRDRITAISSRTLHGVKAKAMVLRDELDMMHATEIEGGGAEPEIALAWSLVNDILGRA